MTAESLSEYAGVFLALLFAYVPGIKTWYDQQSSQIKASLMAGLLLAVAAVIYGLACAGIAAQLGLNVTCDQAGLLQLVQIFVAALIANQLTYIAAVRPFKR